MALLPVLLELGLPLVKVGGCFVAMKGPNYQDEMRTVPEVARLLGGQLTHTLADGSQRVLLVFAKVRTTPKIYPRLPGMPAQKPVP